MSVKTANEEETQSCANKLATYLRAPCIIYFDGLLGAGKTTFIRGLLRGLNFTGRVKSPTYTLMETYDVNLFSIYHFDLYRLHNPIEVEQLGIRDLLESQSILLIEWPEKGKDFIPLPDIICKIVIKNTNAREIDLIAQSDIGNCILENYSR